eukprot:COSAG01_NODE_27394_length_687_cov_0.692177_1_plen_85_part_10
MEREFFMSGDWLPRTGTTPSHTAVADLSETQSIVARALAAPPAHSRLDDIGHPVRNMHADRSRRRIDLNDMVSVDAETIAEQVPL